MPMYNLIECSDNYAKTTGSLWQYCKDIPALNANDEIIIFAEGNLTDSFKFKAKITGRTGNNGTKDVEIMVPLKYLSNFWSTLEMPLINCEISFNKIQHEAKEQRGGFLSMLLGTLGASLLGDVLSKGLSGKGVIRAGEGTIRAGYGSKGSSLKIF